jgi:sec-independent protein translocase protein TatA
MFEGAFANPIHWIFAIIVLVLVFGANKLGDIGGALGKSVKEFKDATHAESVVGDAPPASAPAAPAAPPAALVQLPPIPEYRPATSPNGVATAPDLLPRG